MSAKSEVVVLFASEARQVEHDDELYAALVHPAELQELLKLGAICSFRTLTLP